jgi:hypothetical protein
MHAENLTELESTSQAALLLDDLDAFAAVWDGWAWSFGNADASLLNND